MRAPISPKTSNRKTMARRARKFGVAVLGVVVALSLIGAVYQQIGQSLDRRAVVAKGRMITVHGAAMHLHCTGAGSPTVVLEAGAMGFTQVWAWVQPKLAERARVCSYDRAGLGWSEDAATHDGAAASARLRALLENAGEEGPYMLVGHSMGGALVRIFAARYPGDVVALAFVDPSHPDQLDRYPTEVRASQARVARVMKASAAFSYVGLMRLTNAVGRLNAGLPEDDYRAACMFSSAPEHLGASGEELAAWDTTMKAARANRTLGDRPLLVLSATEPMQGMSREILDLGRQMHAEIAALSTRGRHVSIKGADHMSILTTRDHAERVAELIGETLTEARRRLEKGE
ncbi:alpha/beta fold hydrolase [Polyangium spumosum]|uniref:Alpha/beta fold hydrolase n=1 Tax=Polyangium spumosum TaxID=889282 RepID=A0A6N7PH69_9BACT|nr:alpha/beta hydrolase [Polyangium spumosum]MRG91482.1 alpha/beta fold hydrolase [Polyangium spumosum]